MVESRDTIVLMRTRLKDQKIADATVGATRSWQRNEFVFQAGTSVQGKAARAKQPRYAISQAKAANENPGGKEWS